MMTYKHTLLFPFVFSLSLIGCSGPKPASFDGTVTLKGLPVTGGMVYIMPDGAKGNSGRPTVAPIVDGKFSVPRKFGVLTGAYVITVRESELPSNEDGAQIAPGEAQNDKRMRFPDFTIWHVFPENADHHTLTIEMP